MTNAPIPTASDWRVASTMNSGSRVFFAQSASIKQAGAWHIAQNLDVPFGPVRESDIEAARAAAQSDADRFNARHAR